MTEEPKGNPTASELRRRAEERLKDQPMNPDGPPSQVEMLRLLHELQVHQIELELQNEELRTTRANLEVALTSYTDLYDFAPVGYLTLSEDGSIFRANLAAAQILFSHRSELTGRRLGFFVEEKDRPGFNDLLKKTFATTTTQTCEATLCKNGNPTRIVQIDTLRNANVQECRAVLMDITARKHDQEEICRLNAELEKRVDIRTQELKRTVAIIEASPDFIAMMSGDGHLLYLNHAFQERSKINRNIDIKKNSIFDYYDPEVVTRIKTEALPIAATNGTWLGESVFLGLEGVQIPVSQVILCHKGPDGEIQYFSTVMRDISAQKKQERDLLNQKEALNIANADLAKSARMKDEFLASMSHELRTPLNAVLGLSEALQELVYGPLNPEQLSVLKDIEVSGRNLLALINDILDLAKAGAGQMTLELAPTAVGDVCKAALRLVKQLAEKKHLKVSLKMDESVAEILADERRLKQILVNLLGNAVKFTPDCGSIGLEVIGDQERETIRFTVWDTGIGISQQNQGLLFKPFQQIDSRLSRQYSGTGLGLALVMKMTKLHGGSVAVESELKQGSRFHVNLPWLRVETEAETDHLQALPLPIKKVVVIEDSPVEGMQIGRYLKEMEIDFRIHPEATGTIDLIRTERPDLILLDIRLPDGQGWEILSAIKMDSQLKTIPVIVLSVVDEHRYARLLGAASSIIKPITRENLNYALRRRLVPTEKAMAQTKAEWKQKGEPTGPLVLVAEDDKVNARVVMDYLMASGYRVCLAMNGNQAIQQTEELMPALILMDIQMPEMDGLQATRQIRAKEKIKGIPIIALTALAMKGDREICLAAGVNDYLAKPVSLKKLRATIEQLLGKQPDSQMEGSRAADKSPVAGSGP